MPPRKAFSAGPMLGGGAAKSTLAGKANQLRIGHRVKTHVCLRYTCVTQPDLRRMQINCSSEAILGHNPRLTYLRALRAQKPFAVR